MCAWQCHISILNNDQALAQLVAELNGDLEAEVKKGL